MSLIDPTALSEFESAGLYRPLTLWSLACDVPPERVAIICARHGSISYSTLLAEAEGLASRWVADGMRPGDVVIVQLPNWYEFVLVHLALTRIGVITLPLLPSYRRNELEFIATAARCRAIVTCQTFRDAAPIEMYDELLASVPTLDRILFVDAPGVDLRSHAGSDPSMLPPLPDPDSPTIIMATSGTTGTPKLVVHTHRSTVGGVLQEIGRLMGIDSTTVMFMPSPLSHATGLQYGARMAIALGTTIAVSERWNPAAAADLIADTGAAWIMGATPFLYDLLELDDGQRAKLASLRTFVCGGAPIPEGIARRATELLPAVSLMAAWGMSETGIVTLVRRGDPLDKVTRTDGRPVPGWHVRIADSAGNEVRIGEEAEVQVRGSAMFHGYLGRDDFTAEAVPDGWLRTGDLGKLDEDGYLRCLGRIKDLVIRGGLNISAVEVETALLRHPAIAAVSVVGTPDPRLGERVCAFIILRGDQPVTIAELSAFLHEHGLALPKHPERIEIVDQLPVTPTGKVQKFVLRQMLQEQ